MVAYPHDNRIAIDWFNFSFCWRQCTGTVYLHHFLRSDD